MYKTKQSKPTSKSAVYMGDWGLEENMIPLEKKVLYKHQSTCHYLFQPWLQWNTEKSFLLFLVKCFFPSHFLSCMLSIHKLHIMWKQAPCLCWSYVIINKYDSQSNHNVCKLAYELITNYIDVLLSQKNTFEPQSTGTIDPGGLPLLCIIRLSGLSTINHICYTSPVTLKSVFTIKSLFSFPVCHFSTLDPIKLSLFDF